MKEIIGLLTAMLAMTFLAVQVMAPTAPVTASLTVPGTCGLTIVSGSPMAFGSVAAGGTSDPKTVNVKNDGNKATTDFTVYGSIWQGATYTMLVSQTSVDDGGGYDALAASPGVQIYGGVIGKKVTKSPQFKAAVPADQDPDSYSQTITFEATC